MNDKQPPSELAEQIRRNPVAKACWYLYCTGDATSTCVPN